MASVSARRAAAKLRNLARANRAASAERRSIAQAARRVRTGPRSLVTHVLATGADRATVEGAADALRTVAKKKGVKGRRARIRRTFSGTKRHTITAYRYTRAQVAEIARQYKPRKPEYKAVRAVLLAAA
ncbi:MULTISPECIES: hypothetical protein [unclassified Streptomyces]|uniref:hypothetical protein n=1 Tax=unclassified Streptomyces TaxID=2593676 RepID=UPI002256641A|nr:MULTISPECIES: hypothetical protein [unclassified Streptomyces]MCX4976506.1 hypothetical protein [Streptomyces sp. NBC_00620]WRZ24375.1 hypothetical protein OHT59_40605 [Streptomyces sp. NBC_00243]